MSTSAKTPSPVGAGPCAFDSGFEKEESRVQARGPHDEGDRPDRRPSGARTLADFETITERTQRIEAKMTVARLLLSGLSPMDGRARLLTSAMLRRDEVLLDAVLAEMTDAVVALSRHPSRLPR